MAVRAGRLFLIAAWLCVCAGCGDGASEPLGADAAAFDVNAVSPDAKDVILDAQDVALDAEDLISDAEDVVLDPAKRPENSIPFLILVKMRDLCVRLKGVMVLPIAVNRI